MTLISFVVKDAFVGAQCKNGNILAAIFCLAGIIMLALELVHILIERESFVENGIVTEAVSYVFTGFCMLCIGLTGFIKKHRDKKKFQNEE